MGTQIWAEEKPLHNSNLCAPLPMLETLSAFASRGGGNYTYIYMS